MKIDENLWKSMKIYENWWNSMKIYESRGFGAGYKPWLCVCIALYHTLSCSLYLGTIPRPVVCIWATIPRPGFVFGIQYPVLGLYLGYYTGSGYSADLYYGLAGSVGRTFWGFYGFWWFFIDFGDFAAVERQVRASIYIYIIIGCIRIYG